MDHHSTEEHYERYAKQIKISYIRSEGQDLLSQARCAVIGLGALGSVISEQLARAGIGYLRLIDRDFVEYSNLQRQTLYTENDAKQFMPKATAAAEHLSAINSSIAIEAIIADLTAANIKEHLESIDIIVDGSDNFNIRYLINEYSVANGIPWVYGAVVGTNGSTATFVPEKTPCYQCLFPHQPTYGTVETCDTVGVLSPIVHMIASIQATEVIKYCSGNIEALHASLLQLDCWNNDQLKLAISHARRADCPVCGLHRYPLLHENERTTLSSSLCGRSSVQVAFSDSTNISLHQLEEQYSSHYKIKRNMYLLKLSYDYQITIVFFPDGRAIVQGTDNIARAEAIVARFINH